MELNELETRSVHNEGAWMEVKDQYGNATDAKLLLVGTDSDVWRKAERDKQVAMLAAAAAGKDASSGKHALDLLVAAVIGWDGLTSGGKPVPCSPEAVRKLFVDAPYIADQADRFIARRDNFSKG